MFTFSIGSLVKVRGREWVVLPDSTDDLLVLRPLGGSDDEIAGIYIPLESVTPATFDLPDPSQVGDYRSARLLRDAVRLGFRSSAGPFRSFARVGFEPRPYQLVPLLMALKLDPIRLLVADDVGIGKTIEAGLIARELLDRGEIERLAVLCPPPLAEQWQSELREKFHIEAELVLPSTAARLERNLSLGESLFERYPFVIVSMDYIKSDHRREEFKRTCPEFIIVDEAHTCAQGFERGGRHQRHDLIKGLSENPDRHIVLVTATPHSGKEEAFRSLLTFLDKEFDDLPEDLTGEENLRHRKRLAQHFIQRRRGDIQNYLESKTPFPKREDREDSYKLSPDYKRLFERVLDYARESVLDTTGGQFHQRVRWWSALALLRSLASSPAAAASTLLNRAAPAEAENPEEADEIGRRTILDIIVDESADGSDVIPGSDPGGEEDEGQRNRRRLLDMARAADDLLGEKDEKLKKAADLIKGLLNEGYRPIIFCRFIPTAEYVAAELRSRLPKDVEVMAVTGLLPPESRVETIQQLCEAKKHVLVATDCLSEGINLQEHFDAILHYDLSWNPTRHEQRDGRIDRYGQPSPTVRVLTYYGLDNQIDGVVLDVLLRKHRTIRSSLGISVPVPVNTEQVVEAIFEGLLLKSNPNVLQGYLPGFDEYIKPQKDDLYGKWEAASEREKRSRTLFSQETIKVDDVARELHAVQAAIGSGVDVADFTHRTLAVFGAQTTGTDPLDTNLTEASSALKDVLAQSSGFDLTNPKFRFRFNQPVQEDEHYLQRTHPFVETLANHVLEIALDPLSGDAVHYPVARRCGAIRTKAVDKRTTLLLVRFRYHIVQTKNNVERPLLAEDCRLLAFSGSPQSAVWIDENEAEKLLLAQPDGNIAADQSAEFVGRVIDGFELLRSRLDQAAIQRGEELLEAHQRVRLATKTRNVRYRVEPQLPPDVLGVYIFLPNKVQKMRARFMYTTKNPPKPINVPPDDTTGSDTERNYRYQHGYGVILLIGAACKNNSYTSIYAEHFEDFLCERSDGLFDGYQIKTRRPEEGLWDLADDAVKKSIKRFVELNIEFSEYIRMLNFVSNVDFSNPGFDIQDVKKLRHSPIKFLETIIKCSDSFEISDPFKETFQEILEYCRCTSEELFSTLKKVVFLLGPERNSFDSVIVTTHLAKMPECSDYSVPMLNSIRDELIHKVWYAASNKVDDPSQHWHPKNMIGSDNPYTKSKKITVEIVFQTINNKADPPFRYFDSSTIVLGNGKGNLNVLRKKMKKGNLDSQILTMERRSLSAEQKLFEYSIQKPDEIESFLSQMEGVVQGECDEAYLRASLTGNPIGPQMLDDVYTRLRAKENQTNLVLKQPFELLIGIAGLLTGECKVWWSEQFDMDGEE